jgi:4-amino-4-deoxy-L-arabinose transferase
VAAALPLLLARTVLLGVTDPSEARYAQISREMAEGDDWLAPRWQRVPHLEKPPLAYWAGAAGIELLGRSELAVRVGALAALVGTALLVAGTAKRVAGPAAAAPAAAVILFSALTVSAGVACMTDPFLLFAAALFFHAVFRRLHDGNPRALDMAAFALALGILAKGHMILLFTVVPLALARTGIFLELWRPRRILLLLALAAPWFVWIELRFPGFFGQQLFELGQRASGEGHRLPWFTHVFALVAGTFPFSLYAYQGLGTVAARDRRLLLLCLGVPLLVLTLAGGGLWTYTLPAVPALAVLAGGALASGARTRVGGRAAACAVAGAVAVGAALAGFPARVAAALPVAGYVGGALLLAAVWLLATRRLERWVATAGVAALVVVAFVAGAYLHEGLFRTHRRLAHEVADLAEATGRPVIVAGMSLPSIGFYCDGPVTIAAEGGALARQAKQWGESPLFTPDTDLGKLLAEDMTSVIVVEEEERARLAPDRVPVIRRDGLAVLFGDGGAGR